MVRLAESSFGVLATLSLTGSLDELELLPEERAHLTTLSAPRRTTWAGGRIALRRAVSSLGLECAPILSDDRGAPKLPANLRGSISHKESVAMALATRATGPEHVGSGVDVEYDRPSRCDISKRVLTPRELSLVAPRSDEERGRIVRVVFAIKEAVYKAIDPMCRRYVGFHEVEIDVGEALEPGEVGVTCLLRTAPALLVVSAAWSEAEDDAGEKLIVAMAHASMAHASMAHASMTGVSR